MSANQWRHRYWFNANVVWTSACRQFAALSAMQSSQQTPLPGNINLVVSVESQCAGSYFCGSALIPWQGRLKGSAYVQSLSDHNVFVLVALLQGTVIHFENKQHIPLRLQSTYDHIHFECLYFHLAPVPLKINLMTFSKSHDTKVKTLIFRPTKQISWHSASNVMTLISWHWGVSILIKVNFLWRLRKIITIHA